MAKKNHLDFFLSKFCGFHQPFIICYLKISIKYKDRNATNDLMCLWKRTFCQRLRSEFQFPIELDGPLKIVTFRHNS